MNNILWQNKNVLVTGGTGLVGSHIVEKLLDAKANVFIPYRSVNPKSYFITSEFNKKCVLAVCDLKDYERVMDVISRYEIEYIFHLAAQPIVPIAHVNPYETLQTNITGTINVLEAARHCLKVKSIVVASSDKAYGKSDILPYREDTHHVCGDHPYDVSKSCADLIAKMYYKTYGLPVTVTRFGNIYGAGDLNFNRIIPGAIMAAIKNIPLQIRSDGQMVREYVYVKDVASGYLLLGENIDKTKGEAFNFGSGQNYSVIGIVKKVSEIFGRPITMNILNETKNEIPEQYLSYDKINHLLGWAPQYKIDDALRETIFWYQKTFYEFDK